MTSSGLELVTFRIGAQRPNELRYLVLTAPFCKSLTHTWEEEVSETSDKFSYPNILNQTKLHGLSPRANHTDQVTAACRRSDCQLFADRGCHVVSVTDPYGRILPFLDRSRYFSIK
jgi:hypothetical protein